MKTARKRSFDANIIQHKIVYSYLSVAHFSVFSGRIRFDKYTCKTYKSNNSKTFFRY